MALIDIWHRTHRWPRWLRWPLKAGVFGLVVGLVLFPKVWLLPARIERLRDVRLVIDPNDPGLVPLEADVRARIGSEPALSEVARAVERCVYQRVGYAYDWETWGVVDYLPTVAETLALGREDCDGRAVVGASLLRRLGYEVALVSDLKHMWVVATDLRAPEPIRCAAMSPGQGEQTLASDAAGTTFRWTWGTVQNLARGLAFGVAVFPVGREVAILAALVLVTIQPFASNRRRIAGCAILVAALATLRVAGAASDTLASSPRLLWLGLAAALAGWLLLAVKAGGDRCRSTPPGSPAADDVPRG